MFLHDINIGIYKLKKSGLCKKNKKSPKTDGVWNVLMATHKILEQILSRKLKKRVSIYDSVQIFHEISSAQPFTQQQNKSKAKYS